MLLTFKFTIFVPLKIINKYLAYFLLLTFSWAILPTHTLHELFANHEDTEHDFCAKYHAHLGTHVEKKHTHCEILKTTTPIYDSPNLFIFEKTAPVFIADVKSTYSAVYFNFHFQNIPARGPPTV